MSLNVKISKGAITYSLKAEEISHTFTRMPNQIGLPSVEDEEPFVFSLDLGICVEQITARGIVDSAISPTKFELEDVARKWWDYGDVSSDLARIQIATGNIYYGHIKSMDFKQLGALEDRWQFSLVFLVREKANDLMDLSRQLGLVVSCATVHTEA